MNSFVFRSQPSTAIFSYISGPKSMENKDLRGLFRQRSGMWTSTRDRDFAEQDVWDVLDGYGDQYTSKINQSLQPLLHSPPRVIPRTTDLGQHNSSSSSSHSCSCSVTPSESKAVAIIQQHSAPVNAPRIQRNKSQEATNVDDDGENGRDENVTPEDYFLARSRSQSFSVIEGIGRTLKGRDLSRVRDAVLKKTGFLE